MYTALTPEKQTIARNIFLWLTELGEGTQDTRRRVSVEELGRYERTAGVIQRLASAENRLLTTDLHRESGVEYVEVAHEALIREWSHLRQWLDANRESLLIHRHLTEATTGWLNHNKERSFLYQGVRLDQVEQ